MLEREVKLHFRSADDARAAVLAAGASPLRARRLQEDVLFDTADESLRQRGCALRVRTEAGRSLGCSWFGVIWRIVVPNIMGAIMAAALISVALVLGEFTISSLLNFETLQVVINLLGKRNASIAVAVSLAALLLAAALLFLLSFLDQSGRRRVRAEEE